MLRLLLFAIFAISCGCSNTAVTQENASIPHEDTESTLISEAQFFDRVSQSTTLIYSGFNAILNAADQYAIQNGGNLPSGNTDTVKELLLEGGGVEEWPTARAFAYTDPAVTVFDEFKYYEKFADMDGNGTKDSAISIQKLKVEVCLDFARRYSSPGFGEKIYDFESAGKKYPGETIGRHIKVFAISWSKARQPDYCDLLWVVQYTGVSDQR